MNTSVVLTMFLSLIAYSAYAEEIELKTEDTVRCDGVKVSYQYAGNDLSTGITTMTMPGGPTIFEHYEKGVLLEYGFLEGLVFVPKGDFFEIVEFRDITLKDNGFEEWDGPSVMECPLLS